MGRARTAEAAVLTPRELKAAAVARVLARRRPPQYAEGPDGRGGTYRAELDGGSEFLEPKDTAEWADDRLARCAPGTPASDTLTMMFAHIREGGAAAVPAAVDLAASLDGDTHFSIFATLNAIPPGPDGIGTALVREWKRRGLPVRPGERPTFEPMNRNAPSPQARQVQYRTPLGHNAA